MRRFASVFVSKRDKNSAEHNTSPPSDPAHSSASSSSGSASLYLQTPEDDHHHIPIVHSQSTKKTWKSWLKTATRSKQCPKQWPPALPDWAPHIDELHSDQSDDDEPVSVACSTPSVSAAVAAVPPITSFRTLVSNSLVPPAPPPSPFAHRSDALIIFPRSCNRLRVLTRPHTLASTLLKTRLRARLDDSTRSPISAEELSIASLASRRISPVVPLSPPPHPYNASAPSRTTLISLTSQGLRRWIARPCFEDRYAVFTPAEDGTVVCQRVVGTALAVAALEYSEVLDAMVDFDLDDPVPSPSPLVIDIPSPAPDSSSAQPSSPAHSRNSPYIAVPSPLRNGHNPPSASPVVISQSAPSAVPAPVPEPLVKRGVRFAEDDKDDVIPLGYVLRMKKKREEKARFLRAEHQRRIMEEERLKIEEERRKRDAERAEWEAERRAWEKEKKAMEEEKRQRKYQEEVIASRLRRESQRVGGVPSLTASGNNLNGLMGGAPGGPFPTSASSSASERNKPPAARRDSRAVFGDYSPPLPLPRREGSDPNLPTITKTGPNNTTIPTTRISPQGSSESPGSSRPPSVKGTPTSQAAPPLPTTRSPSVYSSHDHGSSSEDVRAAVAAAARRTKRNSVAASMSHNNSSGSLSGDRGSYPMWTGSNQSLHNMVPPVPMLPMQTMMPMPPFVMMDMPLLPPTPPFMLQQYARQQHGSPTSGSPSGSRGRLTNSQNSSRERVSVANGGGEGSGSSNGRGSSSRSGHPSRSASFPDRPEYRQTSSSPARHGGPSSSHGGDPRRSSMPVSPQQSYQQQRPRQLSHHEQRPQLPPHSNSQSLSTMPRGSSSQKHLQPPPSPWTGLPTQNGKLPNANATALPRQGSHSNLRPGTGSSAAKRYS
ncbi:hypothetical protein Hypma_010088 [Hypsizygus marmoreus]|uniref:Uncharacterized protein n=1 Tax=Hypsizygus marmoreus TaxID=39966 RepID=A0A369JKV3_HYPMA|nr:hypothetical protein Hypma_010088 [Hypsizygus marmoreus]